MMRRRDFITLLGGTAAWPVAGRAQQRERIRRIGVLLPATADDGEYQSWMRTFLQGLGQSGWTVGRNLQVDTHWAGADVNVIRRRAVELVASAPDVIVAHGNGPVSALLQTTRTVPIVFPIAGDPVGTGLVNSLARPGGNATGFAQFEFSLSGKWLELLKQIAPGVTEQQSFAMPDWEQAPASLLRFRPWRQCSGWKSTRSTCEMRTRLSNPWRCLREPRMAV
jgi:putative tryptophan/tyrosine transport system substrate-binding protein